MAPDPFDDPERWAVERSRYLSSSDVGLRQKVAMAAGLSELGYSSSGIARQMDTSDTTVGSYLRAASEKYPGILERTVLDFGGRVNASVTDLPPRTDRECPVCQRESLCSPMEVERVFMTSGWGATSMMEDADMVCSFCHSALIDGVWERMETVDSRAYHLSNSGSKSSAEYRKILKSGPVETGKPNPAAEDAEGW